MIKKLLFVFMLPFFGSMQAQTVSWAEHIAPILFANCAPCHHGTAGHANLTLYSEAFTYSSVIDYYVNNRMMPPWPPDPTYRHFTNQRVLSTQDIALINQWIAAGSPPGDTTQAPPIPVFNDGPQLSNPDWVARIPTYTVGSNSDVYQCFAIPVSIAQDQFITGFEVLPGNRSIVHHVLVYEDTSNAALQLDAASPGPGYPGFGGPGVSGVKLIGAWVPGSEPWQFPDGMGIRLNAGATIIMQIHYPAGVQSQQDSTSILFKLSTANLRELSIAPALNHTTSGPGSMINGPLFIPADSVRSFTSRLNIPAVAKISVLSVTPHMHLIGKSIHVFGVSPTGDTIPVIKIKDWNFQWQMTYRFRTPLIAEGGSTFYAIAEYDNSLNNPRQPVNPPRDVSRGEGTTDEMMLVYLTYLPYRSGDENIIIDSSLLEEPSGLNEPTNHISTAQLYEPSPNPASELTEIGFYLPESGKLNLKLYDQNGGLIRDMQLNGSGGVNNVQWNTRNLSPGLYFVELNSGNIRRTKALLIRR